MLVLPLPVPPYRNNDWWPMSDGPRLSSRLSGSTRSLNAWRRLSRFNWMCAVCDFTTASYCCRETGAGPTYAHTSLRAVANARPEDVSENA